MTARRQVLWLCSLAAAMSFLDVTIVNVAFPSIRASFPHAREWTLSWVINGYSITFAALLVPSGRLADRLGHRRLFVFGMAMFTLGSFGCAVSPAAWTLIACRVLQAVGAVAMAPASTAILLGAYPPERRMAVSGLLGAVSAAAAAFGPSVGGLLIAGAGWRAIFLVNVPFGIAAVVWGLRVIRRDLPRAREPIPDIAGGVCFAIGMGALVLAIIEGNTWGWRSWSTLETVAVAAALLCFALWRSSWHPAPVVDFAVLRIPVIAKANLALAFFAAAIYAKILVDVLYLTSVWHLDTVYIGLVMLPGPLTTAVCAVFTTRLAERVGVTRPASVGLVIYAAGCAWFAIVPGHSPSYLDTWLPGSLLTGVGNGLTLPVLAGASISWLPAGKFGVGSALSSSIRKLGSVLGVALVIALIGTGPAALDRVSLQGAFWFSVVATLLALPVVLTIRSRGLAVASTPLKAGRGMPF